jgi:hypothetical protein
MLSPIGVFRLEIPVSILNTIDLARILGVPNSVGQKPAKASKQELQGY